jgi:hypothetical protein
MPQELDPLGWLGEDIHHLFIRVVQTSGGIMCYFVNGKWRRVAGMPESNTTSILQLSKATHVLPLSKGHFIGLDATQAASLEAYLVAHELDTLLRVVPAVPAGG